MYFTRWASWCTDARVARSVTIAPICANRRVPDRGRRLVGIGVERPDEGDARIVWHPPRFESLDCECGAEADHVGGGDGDRDRRIRAPARDPEDGLRHRQAMAPPVWGVVTWLLQHRERGGTQRDACRRLDVEGGHFTEQPRRDTMALHL